MVAEYKQPRRAFLRTLYDRMISSVGDLRSVESEQAFRSSLADLPGDALCVSVGGGPTRADPRLVNLNIGVFPNVDIVADAYNLPYADGSVDAFHCEAVLEHLEFPDRAVAEMYRALRPGRPVFAATPFLQAFHGYPSHYQNFTTVGHRRLFERAGFIIVSGGTCVGPTFALRDLTLNYIRSVLPGGRAGRIASRLLALPTLPLLWLDLFARTRPDAHVLASTTYLLARTP
jgi:SAM-dependent methyltransferase